MNKMEEQYEEKQLKKIVQAAGRKHLKERLEQEEKQYQKQLFKPLDNRSIWIAAASLLLLFSIGYYFFNAVDKPDSDQLFLTYFEPYRTPVNLRGNSESPSNNWQQAILYYGKGQFEQAIPLFEQALSENKVPAHIKHFYLGISKLAINSQKSGEAIQHFQQCMGTKSNYFQQARWYKALALLKAGKAKEMIRALQDIVDADDFKKEEAQELLGKMKD